MPTRPLTWLTAAVLLLLAGAFSLPVSAQTQGEASAVVHGTVRNAETGQPLPSANIFVEGTRRGTITNREGRYRLALDALPATVVFRYVGYEEERLRVTAGTPLTQDVALAPVATAREDVVVTAERASAADIMRRVIAAKQERQRRLQTFAADAYNRLVARNDTGIVSVVESLTKFFWDKDRGAREVVLSQRQTKNLNLRSVLPAGLLVTNLYDDEIDVAGYRLVGVTHPDALDHYRFAIDSVRALGERAVFEIRVRPRNRFKSTFTGRISVLDEAYALLEAELAPARSFLFPPPIRDLEITYRQQFSDFGGDFWLPVSLRSETRLGIALPLLLSFPTLHLEQVSRLSDYDVNAALPDSLYAGDAAEADEAVISARGGEDVPGDSLIEAQSAAVVPLSREEARAVQTIDSTQTLEEAYAPTGPLARLVEALEEVEEEDNASEDDDTSSARDTTNAGAGQTLGGLPFDVGFAPRLWFNRVEGAHLGGQLRLTFASLLPRGRDLSLTGTGGYQTARRAATYGAGLEAELPGAVDLEASYHYGVDPRYTSQVYGVAGAGRFFNSFNVLRGGDDYFDYYGNERWRIRLARAVSLPLGEDFSEGRLRAGLRLERAFPVARRTSYDLLGRDEQQPPNPPVPEARLRSLVAGLQLGASSPAAQFGITGQRRLSLAAEWAPAGFLGNETDFAHFEGSLDYRWATFLQRRPFPMTLDVRLTGATFAGRLPLQRFTIVEAQAARFGIFGTLRTQGVPPYEGEQHLAAFWEHNFRTLPFEAAGLYPLARRGWNVLLFGGHGRTWIGDARQERYAARTGVTLDDADGFHHEVGVGLSGLLGLFRLDLAKRLDADGWAVSAGVARFL